jgi:glycerol-3-phosphate O-acyltransferase / dihydroxyacetone phosphate acyltransferase
MFIYNSMREVLRLTTYVFFRRIEVVGTEHIPREGASIFFGNHPNSLLDPALISAFGERMIHFAAKDTLFEKPILARVLSRMGAIPIKRRQDHGGGTLDNESAFRALDDLLDRGGAMGIFPEGISHDGSQLVALKSGAARVGLNAVDRGVTLSLIPCGLHYVRRKRFRSSVLIQFGPPIILSEESVQERKQRLGSLTPRALTEEMELHLRALTVNAEDWEDIALLDTVRRLYQPPKISLEDRIELSRRFNRYYPQLKEHPEIQELIEDIRAYREDLYALGLRDREMMGRLTAWTFMRRILRQLTLLLFWLPLAVVGAFIHLPLAYLLGRGSSLITPRKDVLATTKFLLGFLCLNALYLSSALVLWCYGLGYWSLLAPPLLALSGFGTLKVAERGRALWRAGWVWTRCLFSKRTIRELRAQRKSLRETVLNTVDRFLPEDVERLFYTESDPHQAQHKSELHR